MKWRRSCPGPKLLALITRHALVAKTGRPPFDVFMMLRIDCLQQWFGLSNIWMLSRTLMQTMQT